MQQPMTDNIEQPIHNIRSGLRRRYALSRLNRGLARFTETELEDLLSKADIRRNELFTGFKGNTVHRQLIGRMLAHFGVDHEQASEPCWIDLIYAESVCARCCNRRRCRRWLKSGRKNGAPTVFCPNAELFYQTRLALVRKERLKQDKDAQALEDEACIVFLAHYLADFAEKHDSNKVVEILLKT